MLAVAESLKGRDFTRVTDWSRAELEQVLDLADDLKERQHRREPHQLLPGRTLGMIFQKPSTRTRVSFEVGIYQLGGMGLYLSASDLQLGRGETLKDTATVLARYLDAIMIRTFAQADVDELAEHADIPVINGLTDEFHPCHSLMVACGKLGMHFVAATPPGYEPSAEVVGWAQEAAGESGGSVELTEDP